MRRVPATGAGRPRYRSGQAPSTNALLALPISVVVVLELVLLVVGASVVVVGSTVVVVVGASVVVVGAAVVVVGAWVVVVGAAVVVVGAAVLVVGAPVVLVVDVLVGGDVVVELPSHTNAPSGELGWHASQQLVEDPTQVTPLRPSHSSWLSAMEHSTSPSGSMRQHVTASWPRPQTDRAAHEVTSL